ncbi:RNase adapter RapZ [Viridibacterium curvum]|uniref:RNase adapter RapZ n=1 Tax=Viridibacterium curvum TaxID=1101404 RepID=A0ABP9QMX1_9RHOO
MQLTLISGLSGSGKSIALNVLEDAGYYCVDNLPATLLPQLVSYLSSTGYERVGVAIDVRSGASIAAVPQLVDLLRNMVADVRFLFLDSRDDTLIARFSETRRRHPLAGEGITIGEAIAHERELLGDIGELGHRIDTSNILPNTLRAWIKDMIKADPNKGLTLLFQSFGFKHGIPVDADMVFDVRCLPNPYYTLALRPLTGCDQPVIDFLENVPEVHKMAQDIERFVGEWLPSFVRDGRSYFTVAIGCTGGQHRSVYLAERLAKAFAPHVPVLVRHRSRKTE